MVDLVAALTLASKNEHDPVIALKSGTAIRLWEVEELREELWESDKTYDRTAHPDIYRSTAENMIESSALQEDIGHLAELVTASQPDEIISLLDEIVPGSAIRTTPPPTDVTDVV